METALALRTRPAHILIVIAALVAIAALAVVTASVRITDRAAARAVEAREAPARLYLGIEECFGRNAPVPFDADVARHSLAACAESELGRLYAQGGAALEQRGREFLAQASVDHLSARVKLAAGNFERR